MIRRFQRILIVAYDYIIIVYIYVMCRITDYEATMCGRHQTKVLRIRRQAKLNSMIPTNVIKNLAQVLRFRKTKVVSTNCTKTCEKITVSGFQTAANTIFIFYELLMITRSLIGYVGCWRNLMPISSARKSTD